MKHTSNPRRGRGRGGKRNQPSKNRNYESSGGDNKVRGSAQQVLDKYLGMAHDASSAGDSTAAEGFFQHAEHYYRILNIDKGGAETQPKKRDTGAVEEKSQPTNQPSAEAEIAVVEDADKAKAKPKPRRNAKKSDDSGDTKSETAA